MAAESGLSPEKLETDGSPQEKGLPDKMVPRAGLMERLRGRCSQHKSWSDTIKAMKLAVMNDKRHQSDALEKTKLQSNLDKLQRSIKIVNQQSLIERLDLISRQLGLIFTPPTPPENHISLCSDMFKVIIVLDGQSGIKDVRVGHQENPTTCEDLVEVLSNGVFDEFIKHLQGLLAIYSIEGDRKQKTKAYLALSSLESDLNLLAQLQSSINGVANYIHKSPLGILLPRRGGHPMKLIYFVSPYDLLCKKSLSSYAMTVEAITENDLGHSVTICMEPSSAVNKLQTMPLMSVKTNADGKSMPSFQGVNNINSYSLPASFVLVLPQPVPLAESMISAIQDITGLDVICGAKKPLLQVLLEHFTTNTMSKSKELFVTLPDQQHVYFLHNSDEGCLGGPGALVSKIPFKHPTSVPTILNLLRQQLMFNSVLQSLVRPCAKQEYKSAVVFEVTAMSLQYLSVMFEHPLQDSMVTVEFDLADVTSVKCRLCMNNRDENICSNDFVSRAFQRCFSIPVTLRTVLHKVRQQLQTLVPPEPIQKLVTKLTMKWTSHLALKAIQCAANAANLNVNNVPQNILTNLPNPPPYPVAAADAWSQGSQMDGRKYIPVGTNKNFMEPPPPSEERQPHNPLLATLLDAGSPVVEATAASTVATSGTATSQSPSIVNESPMLSKLLEENTSVLSNPFPAPTPKRRLTKRKSSKDMIAGKSPKHRVSDSDMVDRTSSGPSGERYGQGIAEKHIDLDSSGGSYDSEPQRPASVSSVSSVGGQSTGSVIDLTDIGESHVKKLENSLDSIMQKETRIGNMNVNTSVGMTMNNQAGMGDMMDFHMMQDFHHNQNVNQLMGDGSMGLADFPAPGPWGNNNRQTPPTTNLRNSPHHRVVPKNEKISTSLEELLLGPGGRESEGPNSVHGRRSFPMQQQQQQQRRHSLKRQNSAGRSSLDSSTGGISPDMFSPTLTSPGHHPGMSPSQYTLQSQSPLVSPVLPYPTISPNHSSPSHSLALNNIKLEPLDTKPTMSTQHAAAAASMGATSVARINMNNVSHVVTSGKPSLSALKAQLEMKNDVTLSGCNLSQDRDLRQDENSNSSTGSQPPLMKLKLSNMRQYDSISPADSEDSSKVRSSTFDFHSDDEDTLPLVDKIMVVSASPTRLQISNKTTIASFNKFNKSEKFKRKEREKELKRAALDDVVVGKRKRDKDETRKDRKKKKMSNNIYSVENEMAVYKSTTVDVEGSTENNRYKPMPKLKITKSGIKTIENTNSVQSKEVKSENKVDNVKVEKLDKQAIVKIEKVEKISKKEKERESSVSSKSVKENKDVKEKVKTQDKVNDKTPVSKSQSVSDEGIFDRINAMKSESYIKGESDSSNSEKNSPMNSNIINSKKSSSSVKSKTSHKTQRSNSSNSSSSSSSKSVMKFNKTPTIKLKPIAVPHSSGSGSRTTSSTGSTATTPTTPKSVAQSPTSTTIGKIGAVSLATSGSQKSLTPTSNSKSPQGQSSKSSSMSSSSKSSSSNLSGNVLSSKPTSNSQKNIQAQNSSGKNSPIPQSNKSRSLSLSAVNSSKLEKSINKSLSSSNCRTSSPLSEREKSKSNSSSRSSSSSGRDRDRDKSTSSSKNSVPDKTILTQESAASVLSFLNPKANKISSLPPIPKLSSTSGGQKASTPTSSTNTTIVSSTSITTSATVSSSSASSKFAKSTNSTQSGYNKGVNSNFSGANSAKSSSSSSSSSSQKNSYNKSNSSNYSSTPHNKFQNSALSGAVNTNRMGNNSPVNYTQKNSANSYNKGNNSGSANNPNSSSRSNSSSSTGHNRTSSSSGNTSTSGQTSNRNTTSGNSNAHKGSNSNSQGQSFRGSNSSPGNRGTSSGSSSSSGGGSGNRPSSVVNSSANMSNHRGSNSGPNAPKGPGPPNSIASSSTNSSVEDSKKTKSQTSSHTSQSSNRGRKGSLSAVIDKLTCKATIPSIPKTSNTTNSRKPDNKVIIDESPASPEPEIVSVEKKEPKVVIFEAPASPEPSICIPVDGHISVTDIHADQIVSIPLDQQSSVNSDSSSSLSGEIRETLESLDSPEKPSTKPYSFNSELPKYTSSPKVIPLDSPKEKHSQTKSPLSKHLLKQNSLDSAFPQQNGDISLNESARLKAMDKALGIEIKSSVKSDPSKSHNENATNINHTVKENAKERKVSTPKISGDLKLTPDSIISAGRKNARINSEIQSIDSPGSAASSPENGLMIDCSFGSPEPIKPSKQDSSFPVCNSACDSNSLKSSLTMRTPQSKVKNSPSDVIQPSRENSTENTSANSPCFLDDDLMDEALGLGN